MHPQENCRICVKMQTTIHVKVNFAISFHSVSKWTINFDINYVYNGNYIIRLHFRDDKQGYIKTQIVECLLYNSIVSL